MATKIIGKVISPLDPAAHKAAWKSNLSASHRRGAVNAVQKAPKIPNWNRRK